MTAEELRGYRNGSALITYLSQLDASTSVCDQNSIGPHMVLTDDTSKSLAAALRDGKVTLATWEECVDALLRSAARERTATLLDAILAVQSDLLLDKHLESDTGLQARLATLSRVYLERPTDVAARPQSSQAAVSDIRQAIAKKHLGPTALRSANDFLADVELERGLWQGRLADVAFLDQLFNAGDEKTLRRCSERLPNATLRHEARLRVVRLHVNSSSLAEVKDDPTVIQRLMATGTNPVSLGAHPVFAVTLRTERMPMRGVLVEQNSRSQTARLLGIDLTKANPSVLPSFSLRGVLQVEVADFSQPLTVCGPTRDLDATPCIAPADIELDTPFAHCEADGTLRFVEKIKEVEAVRLARQGERLRVPVAVSGQRVAAFEWDVSYNRPEDLIFEAKEPSGAGPNLMVTVERLGNRMLYSATDGARTQQAVVDSRDLRSFHVVSQGGRGPDGLSGLNGMDGTPGMRGMDASCPSFFASAGVSGGAGSQGDRGWDGGDGGPGGNIQVNIRCSADACAETENIVRPTIVSVGGAGGRGGPGGRGGRGGEAGPGGHGAICTDSQGGMTSLSSGSAGSRGWDGTSGLSGSDGRPGRPGEVTISMTQSESSPSALVQHQ